MSNITDLKDSHGHTTGKLLLLTLATGGIFVLIWLYVNNSKFETITKCKIASTNFILWIIACSGITSYLNSVTTDETILLLSLLIAIAGWILIIMWSFNAKKAIETYALTEFKLDPKMNSFYTVLFGYFYICYCTNDLPNEMRKQEILRGAQSQPGSASPAPESPTG